MTRKCKGCGKPLPSTSLIKDLADEMSLTDKQAEIIEELKDKVEMLEAILEGNRIRIQAAAHRAEAAEERARRWKRNFDELRREVASYG